MYLLPWRAWGIVSPEFIVGATSQEGASERFG